MKFFNSTLFHHRHNNRLEFSNIEGYEDIKDIINRVMDSEDNYALLFIGPPASSKTLFLQGILDIRRDGVYLDGSNTTNRILDVLEEKRSKIICLDEIDKMSRSTQNQILNFMESGRVIVTQQKRNYNFEIKGAKVFATANDLSRISKPLQSRFMKLFLKRYTEEEFLNVAEKVLPKLSSGIARYIGAKVWGEQGDIRNVIQVGKLVKRDDGPEQIGIIIQTIMKYGQEEDEEK